MTTLDTDQIWRALGSFYELFPEEERVIWSTFWRAYGEVTADLWGYAFQVDKAKNIFDTSPTMERLNVLVKLSDFSQRPEGTFQFSYLRQEQNGRWVVRGFVPRGLRKFRSKDIPNRGTIRIGVDVLDYIAVNMETISEGLFIDYVQSATFVLSGQPPRQYSDDPEFNESFDPDPTSGLKARVGHVSGGTILDTVLVVPFQAVEVNPTGLLAIGRSGVNYEEIEYQSVTVIGDRYVFTLAPSYQSPATGVPTLVFNHDIDEPVTVQRHDRGRWSHRVSGPARWICRGSAMAVIDNQPAPAPAAAELLGRYQLLDNVDFDVTTLVTLSAWPEPPATAETAVRRAAVRVRVGPEAFIVGLDTRRSGAGVVTHALSFGPEPLASLATIDAPPAAFEARFRRRGRDLELSWREPGAQDFRFLATVTATGERASLDLLVSDSGSGAAARVTFDEVSRRLGRVVGSSRPEDFFTATDSFPFRYAIDQRLTSASGLRDGPQIRSEPLVIETRIEEPDTAVVRALAGDGFEAGGLPAAGWLEIGGRRHVYEEASLRSGVYEFRLRNKIDPALLPVAAGTRAAAVTRELVRSDLRFTGDGGLWLRELPTRDRMWAPTARVDIRHIQNTFGALTGLGSEISSNAYLSRVQGVWSALLGGPSIRNVRSGLSLTMGLPVAKASGTVQEIRVERDGLGRVTRRVMIVVNAEGSFSHELNPDLPESVTWVKGIGDSVERFEPLTNGVRVLDEISNPLWHLDMPGINEIERFNSFGVLVDTDTLSREASIVDAVRLAKRIKPTYTRLFMRFLLTSGNEDMSQDLRDSVVATQLPSLCEDQSFDEGEPPDDIAETLRLGDGHKLGQGKRLGGSWLWHYTTLGQGLELGDGHTLGTVKAFLCHVEGASIPSESVLAEQIVNITLVP